MLRDKMIEQGQKPMALTKKNLRWLIVLSSIPLFGMVAAFGIVPNIHFADVPVQKIVLDLSLPDIPQIFHKLLMPT